MVSRTLVGGVISLRLRYDGTVGRVDLEERGVRVGSAEAGHVVALR